MQIYHLPSKNQNALERQLVCLTFAHVRCILRQTPLSNPGSATFQHAGGFFCARPISRPVKSRTRILRRPGGPTYPPSRGTKGGVAPGAARSAGDQLRDLHEKRSPTRVFWRPSADLSPFQGDKRGCRPWGQREARGINTGICTKKGHRRESMTFFRGDSRIRTGDPLLAKQVLYQLSYTPEVVPGRR